MEVLEQEQKPISAQEIINKLKIKNADINGKRVYVALSVLIKHHEIKYKEVTRNQAKKINQNKVKRRMRIYYVSK